MRKIREVLRLTFGEGLNRRQVGAAVALPSTTVADYVARARRAGLGWPLPESLDDRQLEERLFVSAAPSPVTRPLPDWATVHRELRRPGVTLQLLHLEYKERASNGYQYSQFCRHYWRWQRHLDVVMRQEHRAGQKLFVDFAGQTVPVVDPKTGAITQVELFVAVLGASNYMYAEAFPSQELPHWIAGHVHAFEFMQRCLRGVMVVRRRFGEGGGQTMIVREATGGGGVGLWMGTRREQAVGQGSHPRSEVLLARAGGLRTPRPPAGQPTPAAPPVHAGRRRPARRTRLRRHRPKLHGRPPPRSRLRRSSQRR